MNGKVICLITRIQYQAGCPPGFTNEIPNKDLSEQEIVEIVTKILEETGVDPPHDEIAKEAKLISA